MRKNLRALWGLFLLVGCEGKPPTPPGYQGIVEFEERVLSFETAGRIEVLDVEPGDEVVPGQVIAALDDRLAVLTRDARAAEVAVAAAELELLEAGSRREDIASLAAQVRSAKAAEELAKKARDRAAPLRQAGAISQAELDGVEADLSRAISERQSLEQRLAALQRGARPEELARARARVSAIRAAVLLEDERLERHRLFAEAPGRVVHVHVEQGELASPGSAAVSIADVEHPYVDVFVPEGEVSGIRIGAVARVRIDGASAALDGRVEHVATRTEFTPRFLFSERERPNLVVRVRVRVDDPRGALHAGIPAFAEIER